MIAWRWQTTCNWHIYMYDTCTHTYTHIQGYLCVCACVCESLAEPLVSHDLLADNFFDHCVGLITSPGHVETGTREQRRKKQGSTMITLFNQKGLCRRCSIPGVVAMLNINKWLVEINWLLCGTLVMCWIVINSVKTGFGKEFLTKLCVWTLIIQLVCMQCHTVQTGKMVIK